MKRDWQNVPVPPSLDARPKDPRGYPITFVTLIQSDGRPDFTTIDGQKILRCIQERLCGMCGEGWPSPSNSPSGARRADDHLVAFVGGPLSCGSGHFLDPPMHVECAEYAMEVCPHIATPTARYSKLKEGEGRELFEGVHPDRPDKFGLYITGGYQVANLGGQPIFLADDATEVRWQEEVA